MKAVIFRQHGEPKVLEYTDVSEPSITSSDILVRVRACSINHLDLWVRQGIPAYRVTLPHILGSDVAGEVAQVGQEVQSVKVGDRVVLTPGMSCWRCAACRAGRSNFCDAFSVRGASTNGGYAEFATANARDAILIPSDLSFEAAAAFPLVFLTAWHMLVARAKLQAGETVLVHAAGSGVGHAAVLLAKHFKATVITTVGSDVKIPKAKALGADEVINYQREDFEERVKAFTNTRGVDVILDHIGPDTWEKGLRVLAKGGRLVTCGATAGPSVPLDLRYVFSRQLTILGSMMGTRNELDQIMQLVGDKKVAPVVDSIMPLREARAAQERMLNRDLFGKLVLVP